MDVVTLGAALNGSKVYTDQVTQSLMGGVHYRGSVSYYSDLPNDAEEGDSYTVKYAGTSGTIADGTEYTWGYDTDAQDFAWISFSKDTYSKAEIDDKLVGSNIALTGYAKGTTAKQDVSPTDNVNQGLGKIEKRVSDNENNILLVFDDLKQPDYRELLDYHYGYQMGYYDTTATFKTSTGWACKKYNVSQYAGRDFKLKYVSQRQYGGQTLLEDTEGNITQIAPTSGGHYAEIEGTFPTGVKYLYHSTQLAAFSGREFLIDDDTTALYPVPTIPITPTDYTLLKRKSCVCFIFDDGYDTDVDIKDVFDNAGVKCGFAPIDVKDRYIDYYKQGFSILAHGNSLPSTMNETNVRNFLTERKNVVEARGIKCNGWVTPSSALDAQYRHIVYDLFKYGFTVYKGAETSNVHIPITTKSYDLWRSDVDYNTVATCKSIIDEGIANDDMIVFYGHNHANLENLAEVIQYAKTNSQVLSPDECMDYFYAYRVNEDRYSE